MYCNVKKRTQNQQENELLNVEVKTWLGPDKNEPMNDKKNNTMKAGKQLEIIRKLIRNAFKADLQGT